MNADTPINPFPQTVVEERLHHLKDTEADRDRYRAERDAALTEISELSTRLARMKRLYDMTLDGQIRAVDRWVELQKDLELATAEVTRLDGQNAKYFDALEKIKSIRWGNDGDCGALAIIDSVL